jgi:splicing factor 45
MQLLMLSHTFSILHTTGRGPAGGGRTPTAAAGRGGGRGPPPASLPAAAANIVNIHASTTPQQQQHHSQQRGSTFSFFTAANGEQLQDEYDPSKPNDFEELLKQRQAKQRAAEEEAERLARLREVQQVRHYNKWAA